VPIYYRTDEWRYCNKNSEKSPDYMIVRFDCSESEAE
jgi:hypothetical protein